jgi:hypothetical protein
LKNNKYHKSSKYQVSWKDSSWKYIGQAGWTFRTRYNRHLQAVTCNKFISKVAQYPGYTRKFLWDLVVNVAWISLSQNNETYPSPKLNSYRDQEKKSFKGSALVYQKGKYCQCECARKHSSDDDSLLGSCMV